MLFRKHARAFLVAAVVLGGALGLHRAAASQGERRGGRERWEHCAVVVTSQFVDAGGKRSGVAYVCQFGSAESRCEELRLPFASGRDAYVIDGGRMQTASGVISSLGSQGWQLVGEGGGETFGALAGTRALYFKRRAD